ncbi:hypothetical protein MA16_Dca026199 [Dendrobium catenatum]|uniref:Uncharacterized protein n=1 Tax=Dendrobium catenatum TaxID=906689 RepID=A0A2I0WNW2_9ASPA|nr:hypothetical protein MA16_Dca026199 [Dendrobium catenatum]
MEPDRARSFSYMGQMKQHREGRSGKWGQGLASVVLRDRKMEACGLDEMVGFFIYRRSSDFLLLENLFSLLIRLSIAHLFPFPVMDAPSTSLTTDPQEILSDDGCTIPTALKFVISNIKITVSTQLTSENYSLINFFCHVTVTTNVAKVKFLNSKPQEPVFGVRGTPENYTYTPILRVVGWDPGVAPTTGRVITLNLRAYFRCLWCIEKQLIHAFIARGGMGPRCGVYDETGNHLKLPFGIRGAPENCLYTPLLCVVGWDPGNSDLQDTHACAMLMPVLFCTICWAARSVEKL